MEADLKCEDKEESKREAEEVEYEVQESIVYYLCKEEKVSVLNTRKEVRRMLDKFSYTQISELGTWQKIYELWGKQEKSYVYHW